MQYVKVPNLNNLIEVCFNVYQEIGNQIGEPRTILLRKIISNLECINALLSVQTTHEILIILRSSIETVVLFCYLTTHLDKQQEYIFDSELMELKNTFILVKNWKKDIDTGNPLNLNLQEAINYHEGIFNKHLSKQNQEYVLEQLKLKKYEVTLDNFNSIDKFYRTNKRIRKPFFMDMEKMYSELPKLYGLDVGLRDLIYSDYNINSQVSHIVYKILRRVRSIQAENKMRLGVKYHRDLDLVFARDDGYFICDTTFRDFVNKRLEEAGIEHHKIHSFRHSCATNFFEHKADIKKVSAWLGHSSIGITLDTYTHVLPHHLEELTEFQDKQFKHIFHSNEKDIPDEMLPHKTFAQEDDWGA